jgi:hypothetical protein
MGLKGYRLWVMGQLDSTCRAPPQGPFASRPETPRSPPWRSDASIEGDSLLIGRRIHHPAFSLSDTYSSESDEEEVGVSITVEYTTCSALPWGTASPSTLPPPCAGRRGRCTPAAAL